MKKTLTSLLVGAACLIGSLAQAQVTVNSQQSFDAVPPATSWSTRSVPGGGADPLTIEALDTLVQTNTAALINTALGTSPTVPPTGNGLARQNSTAKYAQTLPTGNAATILMATITNSTGANLPTPKISYDFLVPSAVTSEDTGTAGHIVYYSLTGATNSWVKIPELSSAQPTPVAGLLLHDLSLGSWPAGSLLYIIWVDDNGNGATDGSFAIDNFAITGEQPPPPTIVTQPSNVTNIERRTVSLSVVANGVGIQYVWQKVGAEAIDPLNNPSAATATLVITNAQISDTGDYFVSVTSPYGGVDSTSAHIQINADTVAPRLLVARLGANPNQIILVVDEELCSNGEACGTVFTDLPILTYIVSNVNNPEETLGVFEASSVNTTNIILTLDPETPWSAENVYRITITHDNNGISDLGGIVVPAGTFVDTLPVATSVAVGPTGSATYTFNAAPGNLEFSTGAFTGGADGVTDTPALFDAKVQTLDKSAINLPLAEAGGTPPATAGQAQWASAGGYLITRPTGTAGNVIMAHLRNKSGADRSAIDISYNLTVEATVVEEVLGFLVYYSFSGAPNSWIQIPGLSGDRVTGLKTATLDFSGTPWVTEADLYILFADDNGSGSPDDALEIDNFKVSFTPDGIPPTISQNPSNVTTNEGAVVQLSVVASGSPTLVYQWFKGASALADGGNISGATTFRLTISNAVPADAGSYTVRVNNSTPTAATSTAATVTITPDTTRPVLTRAVSVNSTTISLTFSKQLSAGAALASHYTVSSATVSSAVLANGAASATVTLTTSARAAGSSTLTITGVTDNRVGANLINPNPTVVALTTVQVIEAWGGEWSYNTNNLDAAPTWTTTGGDGWLTGTGLFGTEPQAATIALFPAPIVTVIPPPNAANEFLTSYFRKTVNLPALSAGMSYALNHITDDGAVFYLDGVEIGRFNMPAGAVNYLTVATAASTEGVLLPLPLTASAGSHTLAVSVHQSVNTSSDVVFGAQIVAVQTASPALTIAKSSTNTVVSWTADSSWSLVGSTNVAGPYTTVGGAPFRTLTTPATQPTQFYRLRYAPQP